MHNDLLSVSMFDRRLCNLRHTLVVVEVVAAHRDIKQTPVGPQASEQGGLAIKATAVWTSLIFNMHPQGL